MLSGNKQLNSHSILLQCSLNYIHDKKDCSVVVVNIGSVRMRATTEHKRIDV